MLSRRRRNHKAERRLRNELGKRVYWRLRTASQAVALWRASTPLPPTPRTVLYWSSLRDADMGGLGIKTLTAETLSKRLRENPAAARKSHGGLVAAYNAALDALPDYRGTVLRGLTVPVGAPLQMFLAQHREGATVTYEGFTHTTRHAEIPEAYQGNIELVIKSCHGKHIAPWSHHAGADDEVAFRLGTRFRVTDVDEEPNGYHIIHLREIAGLGRGRGPTR